MTNESLVIYSMNKVGRLVPISNKMILRDISLGFYYGAKIGVLTESERSGLLALHSFLREVDPNQERIGLHRIPTYTGDFTWVCKKHSDLMQSKIPDVIELHK